VYKSGHTAVLAAVHGPIAPRQAQHESAAGCMVSVVIKTNASAAASAGTGTASSGLMYDPEWEDFLTQHLAACIVTERYPRCVISIVLQILNSDGSVLAVALHAAVSALMDAGVDLQFLPTAVTCCYSRDGSSILLDPSNDEEQSVQGVMVLVFTPNEPEALLGCYTTASLRLPVAKVLQCYATAARAVPAIQAFWRLAMEKVAREVHSLKGLSKK
jgi:exosome complex component RRP46